MQSQTPRPTSMVGGTSNTIICQGWVLKKRRKKMQGFARRYFQLQQSGWLSYSFEPRQLSRDQVFLPQAAISTTPGRRDIHIDSGNATFHIKCLTQEDWNMWMSAFRRFLAREATGASNAPTLGRRSTVRGAPRGGQYSRIGPVVEEMGTTIHELQEAVAALQQEEEARQKSSAPRSSKAEKDRKERGKDVLGIFKKVAPHHQAQAEHDTVPIDASSKSGTSLQRIQAALAALQNQHSALLKSIPSYPSIDTNLGISLERTLEEDGGPTPTVGGTSLAKKYGRMSVMSSNSGGSGSVWYDAPEGDGGAEEFVLDPTPQEEGKEEGILGVDDQSSGSHHQEQGSTTGTSTDADTDADTDTETMSDHQESVPTSPEPSTSERQITRRTQLPSCVVGDEGSLFAFLKKNVGKDLSQVAMPVSFNESLTLLQKIAEELEYYDLLRQAAQTDDPVERMCIVAAFAVSTYANTKFRTGRKGFNPMLAETFEEPRMRFIAEKVSHNPVILAYHAEGEGWELWATSSGKTKFWGKSLEIIPQGTTHLKIGGEQYQWQRPSSFMRNLMMGTKYLEHCGKMTITNTPTGMRCDLEFKEAGYWGPSNIVSGTVFSKSGKNEAQLEGKWDEQMARKLDSSYLRVLWRMTPFPKNAPDYYGFTAFGITLNEITPALEGKLPPTDSRLRTDVRALEEGDLDRAEEEKRRIEETQRERRKRGTEAKPRWFKQAGEEWVYTGGYWEQRGQGWKDIEPLW